MLRGNVCTITKQLANVSMSVTLACQCGHLAYWKDTMLTGNECCDSMSSFNNGGGASLIARLIFSHDVGTLMTSGVMI